MRIFHINFPKTTEVIARTPPAVMNIAKSFLRAHNAQPLRLRERLSHEQSRRISAMTPVLSRNAMPPVGPYSQAIKTSHAIYCSGQLPADPSGKLVEGSMTERTRACLQALSAVLVEAGSSLENIVKFQIFLTDMKDFTEMNAEYERFIKHKPARSCVAVRQLPKDTDIEIECIALP